MLGCNRDTARKTREPPIRADDTHDDKISPHGMGRPVEWNEQAIERAQAELDQGYEAWRAGVAEREAQDRARAEARRLDGAKALRSVATIAQLRGSPFLFREEAWACVIGYHAHRLGRWPTPEEQVVWHHAVAEYFRLSTLIRMAAS